VTQRRVWRCKTLETTDELGTAELEAGALEAAELDAALETGALEDKTDDDAAGRALLDTMLDPIVELGISEELGITLETGVLDAAELDKAADETALLGRQRLAEATTARAASR